MNTRANAGQFVIGRLVLIRLNGVCGDPSQQENFCHLTVVAPFLSYTVRDKEAMIDIAVINISFVGI